MTSLRRRGAADAMKRVIKSADGMLEYLIKDALDAKEADGASFTDQLVRIRAVIALIAEEDDPNTRAMAKLYADRLSSKLIVTGVAPTDLRQLEQLIERAASKPSARRSANYEAKMAPHAELAAREIVVPDRARSPARVAEIGLAILGALVEYPILLDDSEVEEAL